MLRMGIPSHADAGITPINNATLSGWQLPVNYELSSELLPSSSALANWFFQRLLACSALILGKTKSKTSENQLAAWPCIPFLMF